MRALCPALVALLLPAAASAQDTPPVGDGAAEAVVRLARAVDPHDPDTDRAVYWCLADLYREVATQTADGRVAANARRAASRYDGAGPTPAEVAARGWVPGSRVSVPIEGETVCETTVR